MEQWAKSLHGINLEQDDLSYERALGIMWDVERN